MQRSFKFTKLNPKLAYVIGVFLGDGSYDKWGQQYIQWSIDLEFVETVRQYCQEFLGSLPKIRIVKNPTPGKKNRTMYVLCFGCKQFGEWLEQVTDGKRKVPDFVPSVPCEETKMLIQGFLDSEGYVAKRNIEPLQLTHFTCGFEATELQVVEKVAELLRLFGVKVTKRHSYPTKNKVCYPFRINIESFCKAGFDFVIKRKSERLKLYMNLKKVSTETERLVPSQEGSDTVRS